MVWGHAALVRSKCSPVLGVLGDTHLFRQPEDLFWLMEAADRVEAERDERCRADLSEGTRRQQRAQQTFGEALDAECEIDRRADHGEIETIGCADIAVVLLRQ